MSNYKQIIKNIDSLNKNKKIVFITGDFNDKYTTELEEKNEKFLKEKGFTNIKKYRVPGALEIPAFVERVISNIDKIDLIITFGVIIRGDTTHYDIVSEQSARAIMDLSVKYANKVAIINGILTCENEKQVKTRINKSEAYSISGLNLLGETKKISFTKK